MPMIFQSHNLRRTLERMKGGYNVHVYVRGASLFNTKIVDSLVVKGVFDHMMQADRWFQKKTRCAKFQCMNQSNFEVSTKR